MLNTIEIYQDSGRKAAQCQNVGDQAGYDFHRRWYRRALALEAVHDREAVSQAYDLAYKDNRNVPAPCPFR